MPTATTQRDLLTRLLDRRDALRRRLLRHRGALAAVTAGVTVYLVVHALSAPPPPTVPVWVAAHDLSGGRTLHTGDLRLRRYAAGTAPDRIVADPQGIDGRVLAVPVGAGMPVRRDALAGRRWLNGYPGLSAMPVRVTDPAVVRLLDVGDRVDLVATDPRDEANSRVAVHRVTVLAVPPAAPDDTSPLGGRLVLVGVAPADVGELSAEGARSLLTVVWPAGLGGS